MIEVVKMVHFYRKKFWRERIYEIYFELKLGVFEVSIMIASVEIGFHIHSMRND